MIPVRALVGIQMFFACFMSYMLRVNMSLNIIAMVESPSNDTNTTTPLPNYGPRYNWNKAVEALILGGYFWGYILTEIPGGFLSERYGPARIAFHSSVVAGVFTMLTPLVAPVHYSLVFIFRFLVGAAGGLLYPALHCMTSRWAPPEEKGKFIAALLGGQLGTVVTWSLAGFIIANMGWIWAFVIPGGLSVLWAISWWFTVSDSPALHRWIPEEEQKHIAERLGDNVTTEKKIPPFKDFLLNMKFWALVVLHFGNLWGLYLLLTGAPQYMSDALGYNIKESGVLASLPSLARLVFGIAFGSIGDYMRRKNIMSVTSIRKFFVIFSHIIPGLLLYLLIVTGRDPIGAITLITFSLGSNGASTLTNLQNHQDLAPNYAGTLYGIMNTIGGTTGFITPAITSLFTATGSNISQWQKVFIVGGSVYVGCGIFYMVFGTGEKQAFNEKQGFKRNKKSKNEEGTLNPAFTP